MLRKTSEAMLCLAGMVVVPGAPAVAQESDQIIEAEAKSRDEIVVTSRRANLIGVAGSASEGQVGQEDLADRPIQRVGELLEVIPGFIATQHSGGGKANQYFLRGFNLDHGTDFAAFHDGVPLNMRTHGHGQGYLDLNFIIPELVERIDFAKGPYRAETGDFATAGAARFTTIDSVEAPFV